MTDPAARKARAELIEQLNVLWRVAGPESTSPSLNQRLLKAVRRAVARLLRPQETFNSAVVQYLNASTATLDVALDNAQRVSEALAARERRMEGAIAAIRQQHDEIQTALGVVQQAIRTMAREPGGAPAAASAGPADPAPAVASSDAMSHTYVGFEDRFRGSADEIRERLLDYVPLFDGAAEVLDIGCGRGEFLDLLRERGINARGIDLNAGMVEVCRRKGLEAVRADALSYLRALPDGSLGGLFAAQVVEHLEPAYLTQLVDAAFDKLRPGGPIVLETINPACWFAFFESYIRDITHVRPLHPDTLTFLLVAGGFQHVEVRYRAPYPEQAKLQPLPPTPALGDAVPTLNENADKINRLLFTYLDYAAIGRRSGGSSP